jgi:hypothetical protein
MLRPFVISITFCLLSLSWSSQGKTVNYRGSPALRTPYDAKYRKVQTFLTSIRSENSEFCSPSFLAQESRIRRYFSMVQSFRFQEEGLAGSGRPEDHWQLPEETESLGSGDCEDLAIWLYCHLLDEGFNNVRFTIGFAGTNEKTMHAWVTWYERGESYILDPSRKEGIYCSNRLGSITYRPRYSYYFDQKWHHQ